MKAINPQRAEITITRNEAAAILSAVEIALQANGGEAPTSVAGPLFQIVEKINAAFEFGIGDAQ